MEAVRAHPVEWETDPLSVAWRNVRGQHMVMTFNSSVIERIGVPGFSVDGQAVAYADWPQLDSPWTSLKDQVLQVREGTASAGLFQIDWTGDLPLRTAAATEWMGWPLLNGWSDTGSFLGPVMPLQGHQWVYAYWLDRFLFVPQQTVQDSGAWIYIPL